jgi:hypothetical protein
MVVWRSTLLIEARYKLEGTVNERHCRVACGMECGVFGKGCTQLRFGILYMNGEVDLGYFRDWRYQCATAIVFLKSNILVAEFSDLAQ